MDGLQLVYVSVLSGFCTVSFYTRIFIGCTSCGISCGKSFVREFSSCIVVQKENSLCQ